MDDLVKPGQTNLRPKPEDCGVKIKDLTASWTEVRFYESDEPRTSACYL